MCHIVKTNEYVHKSYIRFVFTSLDECEKERRRQRETGGERKRATEKKWPKKKIKNNRKKILFN